MGERKEERKGERGERGGERVRKEKGWRDGIKVQLTLTDLPHREY